MVQNWTRGSVPRLASYPQSRVEAYDQRRPYDLLELARHQPPMSIDTALRTHCGIWAKQYFVAVILEDGTPATFFSPGQKLADNVVRQFFDADKFQNAVVQTALASNQSLESSPKVETYGHVRPAYTRYSGSDRQQLPGLEDIDVDESGPRFGRKRPRSQYPDEEPDVATPIMARRGIRVCDSKALWSFYDQRFKNCQQSACKLIAKAWVKAVEPKKQSTHPYTGSDEKAPDWWPKPWGTTKEDKVRHKEPDHLYKRERVHLLNHILSLVVEPLNKQHADIQKLGLNVKKLEECTNEALSGFFSESATNANKKQFLTEIFKVAKQQERYKNGEIDGTVEVYVLNDDRAWDHQTNENDDGMYARDDDEQQHQQHQHQHQQMSSRSNGTQSFMPTPSVSQSPATSSHAGSFLNELAVRNSGQQGGQPPLMHNLGPQQNPGMLDDGMSVNGTASSGASNGTGMGGVDLMTGAHDHSRRSSGFGDYTGGNNGMYATSWQAAGATPSNPQPSYGQPQHAHGQPPNSFVPNIPASHPQQSFVAGTYVDNMPRSNYNSHPSQMFRAGDVPPPPLISQHSYNYNDGRAMPPLPGVSEVIDSVPLGVRPGGPL